MSVEYSAVLDQNILKIFEALSLRSNDEIRARIVAQSAIFYFSNFRCICDAIRILWSGVCSHVGFWAQPPPLDDFLGAILAPHFVI